MEDKEQKIKISFETNADQTGAKVDGLNKKLDTTAGETDKVAESQKKATKSSKDLSGGVESMGGPLGGAVSGFKALIKQMWLLVANPIVAVLAAIVGALALVFKAFTSTNEGADKLDQVLAGLGATIDVLRDRFLKLISLDFKGAFLGFGDEVAKEFKIAADATKSLQEVEDAMRDLGVSRAKLNRDLAASKEIITDETASYKDKKKAIDEVRIAEGKQTDQELKAAAKKLKALKVLNNNSDTSDDDLAGEAKAKEALYKLQEEQSTNRRSLNKLDKKADGEEKTRLKEITDAKTAAYKERLSRQKEAHKLEVEQQKKRDDDLKALLKEKNDAEQNLIKFNQDLADKTEEQKLARQKERALAEIDALKKKGIDVSKITKLNSEKYIALEKELSDKRKLEKETKDNADRKEEANVAAKKLEDIIANKDLENEVRLNAINEEQALIQTQFDNKILSEEEFNSKKKLLSDARKEISDKEVESAKNKLEQEQAIEDAKIGLAQRSIQLLANIFGKSKKAQKAALLASNAVGLAEVAINTVRAVAKDTEASPLTFGMPWAGIHVAQGAIGAGSIIAATAKGLKELGGGNAGSSTSLSSPSGGGGGEPTARPQVDFQASKENQIANTISSNSKDQPPIQAFVVGKQVTTAQELDRNKINSNSI